MKQMSLNIELFDSYMRKKDGREKALALLEVFKEKGVVNTTDEDRVKNLFITYLSNKRVIKALLDANFVPKPGTGLPLLFIAIQRKHYSIVELFIKYGFDKHGDYKEKSSPLFYALTQFKFNTNEKEKGLLTLLSDEKVNVKALDKNGDSSLHYLIKETLMDSAHFALLNNDIKNFSEKISYLIDKKGVDPFIKNKEGLDPYELFVKLIEGTYKGAMFTTRKEYFMSLMSDIYTPIYIKREKSILKEIMFNPSVKENKIPRL